MKNKSCLMTKRKIIYLLSYLAYSAIYIARVNLTMSAPTLLTAGVLDTVEIGILGGAFSAVFASGRLVNGVLSDRVAPPFMIGGGLALCAAANIAFGFFPPFIGIFLLWSAKTNPHKISLSFIDVLDNCLVFFL